MNVRRRIPTELVAVTIAAAVVRFAGLLHPRELMFDEVHTVRFVRDYLAGAYYLDVHPPLGIQLFALAARLLGVDAASIASVPPLGLRLLPAIAGTLLVPLAWTLLRQLGGSRRAATVAAACIALDNALVLQSRLMLTDVLLLTFGIAAVVAWLASREKARRWVMLGLAAGLAGMAASIKWTGLSALGLVLLAEGIAFLREPGGRTTRAARIAVLAIGAASVYALVFAVHFATVDRAYHAPFFAKLLQRQGLMLSADHDLEASAHFYASPWYSWPLLVRPIHYWTQDRGAKAADIYLLGNPLVWWGSSALLLAAVGDWVRRRRAADAGRWAVGFLAAGFAINWIPFAGIGRLMFLYHYLHALVFAICIGAIFLGIQAGWGDEEPVWQWSPAAADRLFWGLLAAVVVLFLFFAPITYGIPLSPAALKLRLWLPGWG